MANAWQCWCSTVTGTDEPGVAMGFGTRVYWRVECIQLGTEELNLQILEKRTEIMLNYKTYYKSSIWYDICWLKCLAAI